MPRETLNLHEEHNPHCERCRNREERTTRDGLCETAPSVTDGLSARCVGSWSFDKIYFLNQYFGIFGAGMKSKWDGKLDYFEICSGPGRCVLRETAREIDGTALTVVQNRQFTHYHGTTFFDISQPVVDALNTRLEARNVLGKACAFAADYNQPEALALAARSRSAGGLNLVFIDPTDCSVPFETLAALSEHLRTVDFIMNIAIGTDANRNITVAFEDASSAIREKYVRFLGGECFFQNTEHHEMARRKQYKELRARFRKAYQDRLRELGYECFAIEPIRHYYELLFASKHPKGLEFWKKAQSIRPNNQTTWDF